jgi:hypothetical protein
MPSSKVHSITSSARASSVGLKAASAAINSSALA